MKHNVKLTMLAIFFTSSVSFSQTNTATIDKLVKADSTRFIEIFKDIHAHPELGFMEVRTAGIVAKELKSLGFEVLTGIGKTGVVGIMKNGEGPIVMYRADMDRILSYRKILL
jgi:hippurate hydrolase